MLVVHVKCQHNVQHTDISLESVIDKSSNLDIAKFGVKNEMSKFNSSCNSQHNLLLEMSNDDLDITVCSPSMTSSPKLVKVLLFCLFSMKVENRIEEDKSKSKKKGRPNCIICRRRFDNKHALKKHISDEHRRRGQYDYLHCYKQLKSRKSLNEHLDKNHYDRKSYCKELPCSTCSLKFTTTDELEEHEWQHLLSANANAHRSEEKQNIPHKLERIQSSVKRKKNIGTEVDHSYSKESIRKAGYATRSKVNLTVEVKKTELEGYVEKEIGMIMVGGDNEEGKKNQVPNPVTRKRRKLKLKKITEKELSEIPKGRKHAKETTSEEKYVTEVSQESEKKQSDDKGRNISSCKHTKSKEDETEVSQESEKKQIDEKGRDIFACKPKKSKEDMTEVSQESEKKQSDDKGKNISSHKPKKSKIDVLKVSVENMDDGKGQEDYNIPFPSPTQISCKLKKVNEDKGINTKQDLSKSTQKKVIMKSKVQKMKVSSSIFAKKVSQKYNASPQDSSSAVPEKDHFCEMCELQFGTIRLYMKHMKSKHPDQFKEEPELITVSDSKGEQVDVEQVLDDEDVLPHKFVKYRKEFANQSDLREHMIKEHQKEQKEKKKKPSTSTAYLKFNFKCGQCNAQFTDKQDYIDHVKSHSQQKKSGKLSGSRYNVKPHGTYCLKCNKDFKNPLKLKQHYKKVQDNDRKICDMRQEFHIKICFGYTY